MTNVTFTRTAQLTTLLRELGLTEHIDRAEQLSDEELARWIIRARRLKDERLRSLSAGRYALPGDPARNQQSVLFYKVDKPTTGKWAGWTFLHQQAGGDTYPIRHAQKDRILIAIANNPKEAMERYGRELGHCGHCGRELTNEVSRARGIGPICAEKMGWS